MSKVEITGLPFCLACGLCDRKGCSRMMAKFPTDVSKQTKTDLERQILRLGVIAELDAISLYEQLAAATSDRLLKDVFLDIAREEKTHVGEFLTLLLERDKEQARELEKGKDEVREKSQ